MDANQNRKEFKFLLPSEKGEMVRAIVAESLAADRGCEEGYPVLSEYFDSEERNSYWQKQFGAASRRRVRSRVYGVRDGSIPPSAFIEVKHKLRGETVKRRVSVDLDEIAAFSTGVAPESETFSDSLDRRVLGEINGLVKGDRSRPVVQIRYHRYAYDSGSEGKIRITFDVDPKCRFKLNPLTPDDPDFDLPLLEPGASIMEVKTIGPVPFWFRRLLGEHQLVPRGFSKYAAALELYEFKCRENLVERPPEVEPVKRPAPPKSKRLRTKLKPPDEETKPIRPEPVESGFL